jgi:hypothetical protein
VCLRCQIELSHLERRVPNQLKFSFEIFRAHRLQSVPVMSKPARRSRIAKFAQPFIVGAFGTAALAVGCGAKSETAQCDGDCQPVQLACPTSGLAQGADCAGYEGLTCGEDEACSLEGVFKCDEEGTWQDISPTCNPPPSLSEECPSARPEVGSDCSDRVDELYCEYGTTPQCGPIERICEGGTWTAYAVDCRVPDTECPEITPEAGSSCFGYLYDLTCTYNDDSCTTIRRCTDKSNWVDESPSCNPPGPSFECPLEVPVVSSRCDEVGIGTECEYQTESEYCPSIRECSEEGTWVSMTPPCNPPPPDELFDCPTEQPIDGESCVGSLAALTCSYGDLQCPTELECGDDGLWIDVSYSCNPPPIPSEVCPEVEVKGGESCVGYAVNLRCYGAEDCGIPTTFLCREDGAWEQVNLDACGGSGLDSGGGGSDPDAGNVDAGRDQDSGSDEDAGTP